MIRYALFAIAILLAGVVVGLIIGKLTRSAANRPIIQSQAPSPQPLWPVVVAALVFLTAAVLAAAVWIAQT